MITASATRLACGVNRELRTLVSLLHHQLKKNYPQPRKINTCTLVSSSVSCHQASHFFHVVLFLEQAAALAEQHGRKCAWGGMFQQGWGRLSPPPLRVHQRIRSQIPGHSGGPRSLEYSKGQCPKQLLEALVVVHHRLQELHESTESGEREVRKAKSGAPNTPPMGGGVLNLLSQAGYYWTIPRPLLQQSHPQLPQGRP